MNDLFDVMYLDIDSLKSQPKITKISIDNMNFYKKKPARVCPAIRKYLGELRYHPDEIIHASLEDDLAYRDAWKLAN